MDVEYFFLWCYFYVFIYWCGYIEDWIGYGGNIYLFKVFNSDCVIGVYGCGGLW